ncbi:MAG: hypothetical protein IBX68_03070 [Dehalococcoidia bacterium]|nr:hypothetical protein [Dehalococcoidia bacterium]
MAGETELVPTLERCIETAARQEFARLAGEFMEGSPETEILEKIDLLRLFLETADFRSLRHISEQHLLQGKRVRFVLRLKEGAVEWEMQLE